MDITINNSYCGWNCTIASNNTLKLSSHSKYSIKNHVLIRGRKAHCKFDGWGIP